MVKADAGRLRQLRLSALASDPDAFGSTHARDAAHPQEHWDRWAAESDAGSHQGLRELTLAVVAGNEPALRAYEAAGFVVRGTTTWRRPGRTLDELIMARRLTPAADT